jgi:hypothetical protein
LAFPLGDATAACFETESVSGGLGDPGADRGAFAGGSLFDRFGEIVGSEIERFCRPVIHAW